MHEARGLKIVEQRRQLGELHRLPDREPGEDDDNANQHDADIEHLLDRVVAGEIVVPETQCQRVADGRNRARPTRSETACF